MKYTSQIIKIEYNIFCYFVVLFTLLPIYGCDNNIKNENDQMNNGEFLKYEKSILIDNLKKSFLLNGANLDLNVEIKNNYNEKVLLSSKLTKPKILFYFDSNHCYICYQQQIKIINSLPIEIRNNLLIIARFNSFRDYNLFLNAYEVNAEIYMVENSIDDFKSIDSPLSFITDSTFQVKSAFFPMKEFPDLSRDYYRLVGEKYLSVKS